MKKINFIFAFILIHNCMFAQIDSEILNVKNKFYLAFDKANIEETDKFLHPNFTFASIRNNIVSKAGFLERIKASVKNGNVPETERTWKDETVSLFENSAVFYGNTSVKQKNNLNARPQQNFVIQVWVKQSTGWILANYQERNIMSGEGESDFFDNIYKQKTFYIPQPNNLLVETLKKLKPGKALDLGMGQGRNAIYMAKQGWQVTGVDISPEGLKQAALSAKEQGIKITPVLLSVDDFDFGKNQWDLITCIYFGPSGFSEKIKTGLKSGGTLIIESHHKDASKLRNMPEYVVYDTDELKKMFSDFIVISYEESDGVADWGNWGTQKIKLVKLVAQKK